jgi:hypothetical protein
MTPQEFAEFSGLLSGKLPDNWAAALPTYTPEDKQLATRQYSNIMLNALAPVLPGLVGGSADLASSNLTLMKCSGDFQKGERGSRRGGGLRMRGRACKPRLSSCCVGWCCWMCCCASMFSDCHDIPLFMHPTARVQHPPCVRGAKRA